MRYNYLPMPNINGYLDRHLDLEYGWVISTHNKQWMFLYIRAQYNLISGSKNKSLNHKSLRVNVRFDLLI